MVKFYKIENDKLITGEGERVPYGFILFNDDKLPDVIKTEIAKIENENRITLIKSKAKELILAKYTEDHQRNILMSQNTEEISVMNDYILNIRRISNEAELNNLELDEIDWRINGSE